MGRHVVIIASGETERRSLPHLAAHLEAQGVVVDGVRVSPGSRALNVEMAEKVLKAAWYEMKGRGSPPDKFVVLVDADGKAPDDRLRPFRENLRARIGRNVTAAIQFACAQWHLEAWYFADATNLRDYLGRAPGVDTSKPDEIENPKGHLRQLLGDRFYTAVISEEIAARLNAQTIAQRSPSFRGFLEAVRNGNPATHRQDS
jgi:hypothetical protein